MRLQALRKIALHGRERNYYGMAEESWMIVDVVGTATLPFIFHV